MDVWQICFNSQAIHLTPRLIMSGLKLHTLDQIMRDTLIYQSYDIWKKEFDIVTNMAPFMPFRVILVIV